MQAFHFLPTNRILALKILPRETIPEIFKFQRKILELCNQQTVVSSCIYSMSANKCEHGQKVKVEKTVALTLKLRPIRQPWHTVCYMDKHRRESCLRMLSVSNRRLLVL
ncbi:hypothetical protein T4B_7899 [Trichinella pseudospiralis]|uniref:Uncharacterized protein n=2 Tax=Trichinella pseudospiralis TaxID=6337 RepID=A0A0V1IWM2_TRIPS|nr:hypothetical protein T4B_7899 [Trichinella pseudospiralis]